MKRALLIVLIMLVGYAWAAGAIVHAVSPELAPTEALPCVIPAEIDLVCSITPMDGNATAFYADCIDRYRNVYHFILPRGAQL